jgi:signal transduction histidine kinase
LQVRVAEQEMQRATWWSRAGLGLALACALAAWGLIAYAHRVVHEEVVMPLRTVADAVAELSGPVPTLSPEAQALGGDFTEVGEQLRHLKASLDERQALQRRTEQLVVQLQAAHDELLEAEKLASLGKLVAGVSHELNSPLSVAVAVAEGLQVQAQDLRQALASDAVKRSALETWQQQLDESSGLLQRNLARAAELLRSFKQVAVDRSGMQRRRFDLSLNVDEVLVSLRPVYGRSGVALRNELPVGLDMDSYPGPWGQVLGNLVANAVLHGFEERTGWVRVALVARDAERVTLLVEDDGQGMSDEVRERAFEPFFSTKLGQGGSGLGLAIVRNLVVGVLGGRIQLESAPGKGCRFLITLPWHAPEPTADALARASTIAP